MAAKSVTSRPRKPYTIRPCLLGGSVHPELSEAIAKHMGLPLVSIDVGKFSNGETHLEIKESCRGRDAVIIQPLCGSEDGKLSVNDALMEVLLCVAALRANSAHSITVLLPHYGYARQDKLNNTRTAISARLVANLLEVAGIDRGVVFELHAPQIQGFFGKPLDNLDMTSYFVRDIKSHVVARVGADNIVCVSPDAGGVRRASDVGRALDADVAIISKQRRKASQIASMRLVGDVQGRIAIIIDDMADTCGTLVHAARLLHENGAVEVHAYVAHGIFSGPAIDRINGCAELKSVVASNSIPQKDNLMFCPKLRCIDVSHLLATAVSTVLEHGSLSQLLSSRL